MTVKDETQQSEIPMVMATEITDKPPASAPPAPVNTPPSAPTHNNGFTLQNLGR